jgi:hypothetical protein
MGAVRGHRAFGAVCTHGAWHRTIAAAPVEHSLYKPVQYDPSLPAWHDHCLQQHGLLHGIRQCATAWKGAYVTLKLQRAFQRHTSTCLYCGALPSWWQAWTDGPWFVN